MLETITISFAGDDNMQVHIMRILSLYLASLRCSRKIKAADVCAETGVHIKNLNRIETGKTAGYLSAAINHTKFPAVASANKYRKQFVWRCGGGNNTGDEALRKQKSYGLCYAQ